MDQVVYEIEKLENIKNPLTRNPFIDHAFVCFNAQFTQYLNDTVYVIYVYLWPACRYFTISENSTYEIVQRSMVMLSILWKFIFAKYSRMCVDLKSY